jgi:hypothetical protein
MLASFRENGMGPAQMKASPSPAQLAIYGKIAPSYEGLPFRGNRHGIAGSFRKRRKVARLIVSRKRNLPVDWLHA